MTPYLIFFSISLLALAYGTYTDFKERIVNNWATYGLIFAGLLGHGIWASIENNPMIFAYSLGITIATFILSYSLYKLGAWAGGDVKMFTGLAAANPFNPNILTTLGLINIPIFQTIQLPIFPASLFIFSLLSMLPYGAMLAFTRLLKNKKEKEKFKQEFKNRLMQAVEVGAIVAGLTAILGTINITQWLILPLLFITAFLPKKAKAMAAGLLLLFGLWQDPKMAGEQFIGITAFLTGFYILFKLYKLSKVLMRKKIPMQNLEEGMISAQTLIQTGKKIEIMPDIETKKLIKYFVTNKMNKAMQLIQPKGKTIVSSRSAGGLTGEEILLLKKLAKENKVPKELLIKESAPFVPAILIAYVLLNIVGDVIWLWLL